MSLKRKTVLSIQSSCKIHTATATTNNKNKNNTNTHICVGLEQACGATCAHLVTLQSNHPFTNVHTWVEWTLCNDDITPEKKENKTLV